MSEQQASKTKIERRGTFTGGLREFRKMENGEPSLGSAGQELGLKTSFMWVELQLQNSWLCP